MTYYLLIDIVLIYETLGIILKKGTGDNHQIFLSLSVNGHNRQAVLILYKIFIIQEGNMTKKTEDPKDKGPAPPGSGRASPGKKPERDHCQRTDR